MMRKCGQSQEKKIAQDCKWPRVATVWDYQSALTMSDNIVDASIIFF